MGPLVSAEQLAQVERYVDIGRQEGAELRTGGSRPDGKLADYPTAAKLATELMERNVHDGPQES